MKNYTIADYIMTIQDMKYKVIMADEILDSPRSLVGHADTYDEALTMIEKHIAMRKLAGTFNRDKRNGA
jgi:hypothetical protein